MAVITANKEDANANGLKPKPLSARPGPSPTSSRLSFSPKGARQSPQT